MCVFVVVVIYYFYFVGFVWMLFEGVYLYLLICKVFNIFIWMWFFYVVVWGRLNINGVVGVKLIDLFFDFNKYKGL